MFINHRILKIASTSSVHCLNAKVHSKTSNQTTHPIDNRQIPYLKQQPYPLLHRWWKFKSWASMSFQCR